MGCKTSLPECEELALADTITISGSTATRPALTSLVRHRRNLSCSTQPFDKVRTAFQVFHREQESYKAMQQTLEAWETRIYLPLIEVVASEEDLRTSFSLNAAGTELEVMHEVDGLRSFDFIHDFAETVSGAASLSLCKETETYVKSLTSLTACLYLKLAKDMDWGLGVRKPLDRKSLVGFLQGSADKANVLRWSYASSQPIPVEVCVSCLHPSRKCTFYSFDSHKYQNYSCAFSLFEHFGVPLSSSVQSILLGSSGEEAYCSFELINGQAQVISILVSGCADSKALSPHLDMAVNLSKWQRFASMFEADSLQVSTSPQGLTMTRLAHCSSNRKMMLL